MGRNYFELCNEILQELFYETWDTWEALSDTTEGKRVKQLLNNALREICLNEGEAWKFMEREDVIPIVNGKEVYPWKQGHKIRSITYNKYPINFYWVENFENLPRKANGFPTIYWIYGDTLHFYPIPGEAMDGKTVTVRYRTSNLATDLYGVQKPKLVCEEDEPIIPEPYRDILIWAVCTKFRASVADDKSNYYAQLYQRAYRQMLSDQTLSQDYPTGLHIHYPGMSIQSSIENVFYNPRVGRWNSNRG